MFQTEWEKQLEEMIKTNRDVDRLLASLENSRLETLWLTAENRQLEAKIAQLKMELAELEEISSRQDLGLRIGRGIKCWMKESDWEANLPLIDWLLEVIEKLFD